jgi:hypothetical protein
MEKLSWEYVNPISHPDCYYGDRPAVLPEQVPDHYWTRVETDPRPDTTGQYHGLRELIRRGELIRDVHRYTAVIPPVRWQELRDD